MVLDDSWAQAAVGGLATVAGMVAGGVLWIVKLGSRVAMLETRMKTMETGVLEEQHALLAELREARDDIVRVGRELASSREEALRYFAGNGDLQRLEDKLDELRGVVAHQQAIRRRPG